MITPRLRSSVRTGICWAGAVLLLFFNTVVPGWAQRRVLAPALPTALGNTWLWLDEEANVLRPFVAGSTAPQRVLYQPLPVRARHQATGVIRVRARAGQCLFLNNQLIFTARVSGTYVLDLTPYAVRQSGKLLAIWHPTALADPDIFLTISAPSPNAPPLVVPVSIESHVRLAVDSNRNVFIVMLLAVGLLYGVLRTVFGISLSRFLRLE